MNKKSYARILDIVAGEQVPQHLDLAPDILARIQKRKGIHMQPRTKLISAALLAVIVLVVLFYTVPGVAAAVERAIGHWFGYIPSVGLVREGQIRVLANPVSVTRAGVTVTIDQLVLDPEKTVLVYSVDGIPGESWITQPLQAHCPYQVSLRLPGKAADSPLLASPNGIQAWGSGYQHRFNYPPLPAAVNDATVLISCLFNTRPGTAPENWEIPVRFVPAPPDVTAFPVIEIPTPTALAMTPARTIQAVEPTVGQGEAATGTAVTAAASPQPATITLTLDRAVQMDDGYLIYATLDWKDTPYQMVDVTDPTESLRLLDANGKEMLYELRYDENTRVDVDQRRTIFAIKTAPVQTPGPLTLALDWVSVDLPVKETSFIFDPGPAPKTGQTWTLNKVVEIGKYSLLIRTATVELGGYSFDMSSVGTSADTLIVNASLGDLEHTVISGSGGGGGGKAGDSFFSSFNYGDGLPDGPITVTVGAIGVRYNQRLEAQWTPPAASPNLLPTQSAACLTTAAWKTALKSGPAQKPALPKEVTGRVLTSGMLDNPTSGKWGVTITSLDGLTQQVIEGGQDGSFSPDGMKLAYSTLKEGISILDLTTNQTTSLPGTGNGDFNPIWSPSGQQIVFMRGMGIFDLFITNPDGTDQRQLTHGGVQEWPAGWLSDGKLLYVVPGREDEYTLYQVDVHSGASEIYSHDNLSSLSPDGRYMITTEKTFGDRWLTYISEKDGANRRLLADSGLWVLTPILSPDDQWILAGVSDKDPGAVIGALVNLSTCQVIPIPTLQGNFLSWVR